MVVWWQRRPEQWEMVNFSVSCWVHNVFVMWTPHNLPSSSFQLLGILSKSRTFLSGFASYVFPCFLSALAKGVGFFSLTCVFALWRECFCGVHGQIHQRGEVGRVTEETQFVFGVWMSYYSFLLFTQGMGPRGELWFPQLSAVVNGFTLDLDADDSVDEGGEKTLPQPTVA